MQTTLFSSGYRSFFALLLSLALCGCAAERHHRAGLAAMDSGDYRQAIPELRQAAALRPLDAEYQKDWLNNREKATNRLVARAELALGQGRMADATELYEIILKYEPGNARAQAGINDIAETNRILSDLELGRAALKRGELAQARRVADRAVDRMPGLAAARTFKLEVDASAPRETPALPGLANLYRKPISLEFRDASIKMVFDALSRTTGINFIFDRDVKPEQRTTVLLKQTLFEDAIDVILATNQLEKKVLNATSVLVYPNTPAKVKEYQDLLVKAFYLANVDAKVAANLLKSVLKLKDVYVDEKYHMLVLRENADTVALAEKLIALQDLEEPEVMLDVEVMEVSRNSLLNLGIQLTNQLTVSPLTGVQSSSGSSTSTSSPSYKLSDLLHLNSDRIGVTVPSATISLQKTDGDANLLANPRLRVRDREKAKILIGDKVPVVTTTTTPNGFLSENVQYIDVGLKLDVEPEIHVRDEVALKIALEVSSLVGTIKTATGTQAYQIGTRNVSTSLRLRDGETQVLAGLISNAERTDANRIPLLGDVPLLGRLFSSQKDDHQRTEIVMSLTPHLIRNIKRQGPAAEEFWSGTETALRTRPIQLGNMQSTAESPDYAAARPVPAADTGGVRLRWNAPQQVKLGQTFTVEILLESKARLRAAPLQLAFAPGVYEVLSAKPGAFFGPDSAAQFSHVFDAASGRVAIGLAGTDTGSGGGRSLVQLELRALKSGESGDIAIIGMTPIGQGQSVTAPALPVSARIVVE